MDGQPADIGFRRDGYLFIVPPSGRDVLQRNFDVQQGLGCDVRWLEPDELKLKFPSMNVADLGAAVHSPDDGWLDPYSVLAGFRVKARSMGATFLADEVVGLDRTGAVVTAAVLKSGRRVDASHFVNAAGAWAKDICAMLDIAVPIEPLRRFEHFFECQDPIEPLPYLKDTAAPCVPAGGQRVFRRRADARRAARLRLRPSIATTSSTPSGRYWRIGFRSSSGPGAPGRCRACTTRTISTAMSSSGPVRTASAISTCCPGSPDTG